MTIPFSAGEVFEIAQQIERNGARFYRLAAERFAEPEIVEEMLRLAAMEDDHERTFAAMAGELSDQERQTPLHDPYGEVEQYLRALAAGRIFDLKADPEEWFGEGRSLADVLARAVGAEKDSVVFYVGVRQTVPEGLGRERIDGIIREEMAHVALLSERLAGLTD